MVTSATPRQKDSHSGPVYPGPMVWLFAGQGRLIVLLVVVLFVLWLARGIVGPFVVAAMLAYAFSPIVSAVEDRTHWPRVLVTALGYVLVLGLLALLVVVTAERAGSELRSLTSGGPDVIASALQKLVGDRIDIAGNTYVTKDVANQLRDSLLGMIKTPTDAIHMAEQAVNVGLQAILCLIVTFYFILDGRRFGRFALGFLEPAARENARRIGNHIHVVLGRWLRGQLFLIALVATVLYVALGPILHVPYALALSILSGVLEIIPLVGPVIAAALAGTVAFATHGTDTTIVVLAVYLVVRQVEDQIVMPLVIGRAVHLHPVVTIFSVLVGLSAFGVLGGLLGVPVAAALNVTLRELYPEETGGLPGETPESRRLSFHLSRRRIVTVERVSAEPMAERTAQARPRGRAKAAPSAEVEPGVKTAGTAESSGTAEGAGTAETDPKAGGPPEQVDRSGDGPSGA